MFHEITKDNPKFKQLYFVSLGVFLIPLVEIWVAYYSLATGSVAYAVKDSLTSFLTAFLVIVAFWIIISLRLEILNPSTATTATSQTQKLDSGPESVEPKEERNKLYKTKISFLGLFSIEQEEKDDDNKAFKERKLQIDIAKRQSDVQLWGTFLFGIIAFFSALFIVFFQEYFVTVQPITKVVFSVASILIGVTEVIMIVLCTKKLVTARDKLFELES
jgi:hypothetical protein